MLNKKMSTYIIILCVLITTRSYAARPGITGGYGSYWHWEDMYDYVQNTFDTVRVANTGFLFGGYLEFPIGNFAITPATDIFIVRENTYEGRYIDVVSGLQWKFYPISSQAKFAPFLGIEPELHMMWGGMLPVFCFGFSGIVGVNIGITDGLQLPIQLSYGTMSAEYTDYTTFAVKLGISGR